MAKKTKPATATKKADTAKKKKAAAEASTEPGVANLPLARFLILLAVDDDVRARFNQNRRSASRGSAIDRFGQGLSNDDKTAVLDRNDVEILRRLNINNQST